MSQNQVHIEIKGAPMSGVSRVSYQVAQALRAAGFHVEHVDPENDQRHMLKTQDEAVAAIAPHTTVKIIETRLKRAS